MYCYWTGLTRHKWLSISDSQACSFPLPTLSLSRVSLSALASTGDFAHLWIAVEEDEWEWAKVQIGTRWANPRSRSMLETMFPKFFWSILIPFFAFFVWWRSSACASGVQQSIRGSGGGGLEGSHQIRWVYAPPRTQIIPACALAFLLSAIFISVGAHLLCAFGFKRGVIWVGCVLEVQIRSSSCIPRTQNTPAHGH